MAKTAGWPWTLFLWDYNLFLYQMRHPYLLKIVLTQPLPYCVQCSGLLLYYTILYCTTRHPWVTESVNLQLYETKRRPEHRMASMRLSKQKFTIVQKRAPAQAPAELRMAPMMLSERKVRALQERAPACCMAPMRLSERKFTAVQEQATARGPHGTSEAQVAKIYSIHVTTLPVPPTPVRQRVSEIRIVSALIENLLLSIWTLYLKAWCGVFFS